jgi:hypothetical protein
MLTPYVVSIVFVLTVIALCWARPNAGRIFLGGFFLVMALGVNGYFTFAAPQGYVDYASGALIPLYRSVTQTVVAWNPRLFGLLLMLFEVAMGLLILHKGRAVKVGLWGTIAFLVGIAPLSTLQFPWLGLIFGQGYLLTKDFDHSALDWQRRGAATKSPAHVAK